MMPPDWELKRPYQMNMVEEISRNIITVQCTFKNDRCAGLVTQFMSHGHCTMYAPPPKIYIYIKKKQTTNQPTNQPGRVLHVQCCILHHSLKTSSLVIAPPSVFQFHYSPKVKFNLLVRDSLSPVVMLAGGYLAT